jgi:hypothetical protein
MKTRKPAGILAATIITTLALTLSLTACPQSIGEKGSGIGEGGSATSVFKGARYQAIPDTSTGNDKIKYSYTYSGLDFYYIYLGQLRNVPLFYDDAQRHSWNYTSSTYTWSTTSVTTETVSNVVSRTSQETVSVTNEYTEGRSRELKLQEEIKGGFKPLGIGGEFKLTAEESFSHYWSDTTSTGFQKTTSLTNTVEYATSNTESLQREKSYTLTKADREGYYRYTCFSVSDVYLYVVRNPNTNEIYYEFREYIVPGTNNIWDLEYCETPDFIKSDASRFRLDISILNNLPATKVNLGGGATPPPPVSSFTVKNISEWDAAISVIQSGGNGTAVTPRKYTITVSGNIAVPGTTSTFGSVSNVEVTLKGNGKLYLSSKGRLLSIDASQTVIIDSPNLTLQGLKNGQNGSKQDNTAPVVYSTYGKLELKNGTISGNARSGDGGGGVQVTSSSTFTMSGGTISGNTAKGVYCGGGVHVVYSTFNKTGSSIIYGNDASASLKNTASSSYGHAVCWLDTDNKRYYRNATVGASNNMSTSDYPLPQYSGETKGYWTMY